ncbi:MAG: PAS domain S-box protein [Nostocaceae cyanobacterium]|nr:PAS domain S-box protein [Nostocaceae cyanobacterium]
MTENLITVDKTAYQSLQQELVKLRQEVVYLEKFQSLMHLFLDYTPSAIAIFDYNMRYIMASQRWQKDYGLGDQDIIGRSHYEIFPEIPQRWQEIHQRCLQGNIEKCEEDFFIRQDGKIEWLKWEIHPWYDATGTIGGIIMFTEVITQRKQLQQHLSVQNALAQVLAESENLEEGSCKLVEAICSGLGWDFGELWIVDFQADLLRYGVNWHQENLDLSEFITKSRQLTLSHGSGIAGQTWLANKPILIENVLSYTSFPRRAEAAKIGLNSAFSFPIINDNQTIGVINIFSREQQPRDPHLIQMMVTLGEQLGLFIERKQLKKLNEELEVIVEERTIALSETEARLQRLTDNVPGMLYEFRLDRDGKVSYPYISSGCREILGLEPEQIQQDATLILSTIHPDDVFEMKEATAYSAQTLENWEYEWRTIMPSGEQKWVKAIARPELQSSGEIIWYSCLIDITERKRAEEEKQIFVSLIENSTDFIGFATLEGELLFVNEAGRKLVGVDNLEDAKATPIINYLFPGDREELQQYIIPTILEYGVWQGECRFQHFKTQEVIPVDYNMFLINNPQTGEPLYFATITRDNRERKRNEEQLRQQELFLRSVYHGAEHSIFVVNVLKNGDLRFAGWNSPTEKATGISNQDVVNKSPEEIFGKIQGAEFRQKYQSCLQAGKAISYEESLNFDGTESWWLTTINPLKDNRGYIYRLVGTTFNITERKLAEVALKGQAQLSAFRADINSILVINHNLQEMLQQCTEIIVQYLDAAFARIWTLNSQENVLELQASAGMYTHIDGPHSRVPVGKFKIGLIAEERQPHLTNSVQTDPRVGDKEWAKREDLVAFAGYPLIVNDQLMGVIAMFAHHELPASILNELAFVSNDISLGISRKQAEINLHEKTTELEKALHKLQRTQAQLIQSEKMSSLGQTVAGVAHEINNPVNFIHANLTPASDYAQDLIGLLKLYQQNYPNPPAEIEAEIEAIDLDFLTEDFIKLLDSMKEGTRRIREIVLSLRNFSRLDEAELKQIDIHEGIESTLMILQNRLKAKPNHPEIQVVKNYSELSLIECYPGQLNQVFMNILANGIDALETVSNPCIHITTKLLNNNRVAIHIADNGLGIPQDVQAKLFDPFFTTKDVGKGTGLGLSISYQIIVDQHGGNLSCQSTPEKGAEFIIEIPINQCKTKLKKQCKI